MSNNTKAVSIFEYFEKMYEEKMDDKAKEISINWINSLLQQVQDEERERCLKGFEKIKNMKWNDDE